MTNQQGPASYIRRAEHRLALASAKIIENYTAGKYTFEEFMNELRSIDDARIYEEAAAEDEVALAPTPAPRTPTADHYLWDL